MTLSRKEKAAEKALDTRLNRLCGLACNKIQISIWDLSKVSQVGKDAIKENPLITDEDLTDKIRAFVETIRKN